MKRLLCIMICTLMLTGCGEKEVAETNVSNTENAPITVSAVNEENVEENDDANSDENPVVNKEEIYDSTIAQLGEENYYAVLEINAEYPVLIVTTGVYDDGMGNGNLAALEGEVYYVVDGEVQNIGNIASGGTAYPISYDQTGIYTGCNHDMCYYEINEEEGRLVLKEGVFVTYDENGTATYTRETESGEEEATEADFQSAVEKFEKATVVYFEQGTSK